MGVIRLRFSASGPPSRRFPPAAAVPFFTSFFLDKQPVRGLAWGTSKEVWTHARTATERTGQWRAVVQTRRRHSQCRQEALRPAKPVHGLQDVRSRLLADSFARRGIKPCLVAAQ